MCIYYDSSATNMWQLYLSKRYAFYGNMLPATVGVLSGVPPLSLRRQSLQCVRLRQQVLGTVGGVRAAT